MHEYSKEDFMKRIIIISILLTISCLLSSMRTYASGIAEKSPINTEKVNYVYMDNPVQTINNNGITAFYSYSDTNVLKSKVVDDCKTVYTIRDGLIVEEISDTCTKQYEYELYEGLSRCCTIVIDGTRYDLGYDDINNVSGIFKDNKKICEYVYNGCQCIPYPLSEPSSSRQDNQEFIGLINPFRYQGWYYDTDVALYYLGEGIFYNPQSECFIQNDYTFYDTNLSNESGLRSLTLQEQSSIQGLYNSVMNSPGYGGASYSNVTQSQWNQGKRWYDGVSQLEVIARCIWAENNGVSRSADRTGEAVVIMNRRLSNSQSALQVVTAPSQFSTVNPGSYSASNTSTANTRSAKSKTDTRWQQATLLACVLIYADERSDIGSYYTIPAGITTQQSFRGLNHVSILLQESTIYIAGSARTNIAIAGYGVITASNYTELENRKGASPGYNVFFD